MTPERLEELLGRVQRGDVGVAAALAELRALPFTDLGYARVDQHRALRQGLPEVVFAPGKSPEQIVGVARALTSAGQEVLVTRLDPGPAAAVLAAMPELEYLAVPRLARTRLRAPRLPRPGRVAVVTAGTADVPVAEEAAETLVVAGVEPERIYDVGVAGLQRTLAVTPRLVEADALIVVAGMEGALASVVGGLVSAPVIAVPTSTGYGTALSGFTALFAMLTSCAAGVTVVNVDNGFGAAMAVLRLLVADGRREGRR